MKKLHFTITINAPAHKVYEYMLGINDKSSYEAWTTFFDPTSTYEGTWEQGTKILFIGTDEHGEKGGMVSRIAENTPNQFVSIQHYGLVKGGEEITEGPEVEQWANAFENYTFEENDGITTLSIDTDISEEYREYMEDAWHKALGKLKEMCE